MLTTLAVSNLKPEKDSGLNAIQTYDLCDTGVVLCQLGAGQFLSS